MSDPEKRRPQPLVDQAQQPRDLVLALPIENSAAYLNIVAFIENLYRIRNLRLFVAKERGQLKYFYPTEALPDAVSFADKALYNDPILRWINGETGHRFHTDHETALGSIESEIRDLERQQRMALPYSISGHFAFVPIAPDLQMCELEYPELFGYRPDMTVEALRAKVSASEGLLTERDVIWVLLSFPQTSNYVLLLDDLVEIKKVVRELKIPDYYVNGFVSSQEVISSSSAMFLREEWKKLTGNTSIMRAEQKVNTIARRVSPAIRTNESYFKLDGLYRFAEVFSGRFSAAEMAEFQLFIQTLLFFIPANKWPTGRRIDFEDQKMAELNALWLLFKNLNQYSDIEALPKSAQHYRERMHIQYLLFAQNNDIPIEFVYAFADIMEANPAVAEFLRNSTDKTKVFRTAWQMWISTRNVSQKGGSLLHLSLEAGDL